MFAMPDLAAVLWLVAGAAACARGLWTFASGVCAQKRTLSPLIHKGLALFCLYKSVSREAEAAAVLALVFLLFCVFFLAGGLLARRRGLGYMTLRAEAPCGLQTGSAPRQSTASVGPASVSSVAEKWLYECRSNTSGEEGLTRNVSDCGVQR